MEDDINPKSDDQIKLSALRLLVLTPSADPKKSPSPFPSFLEELTGTTPSPDITTFAGYTSHPALRIKTRYYESDVGIWCDELPPAATKEPDSLPTNTEVPPPERNNDLDKAVPHHPAATGTATAETAAAEVNLSEWQDQMLGSTAREVRDVIGGIVLLLPLTTHQTTSTSTVAAHISQWAPFVQAVASLRDTVEDESGRDVASLVVVQDMVPTDFTTTATNNTKPSESLLEPFEDECLSTHGIMGWDYVYWSTTTTTTTTTNSDSTDRPKNEYGEATGFARIREILANTDWTARPDALSDDDIEDIEDIEDKRSEAEMDDTSYQHEFQREMLRFKMAMLDLQEDNGAVSSDGDAQSSLVNEFDARDLGLRTPLRQPRTQPRAQNQKGGTTAAAAASATEDGTDEGGNEEKVDQLSGLMQRVVAIRDQAGNLPAGKQKERFARREIGRIMKDMNMNMDL